MLCDTKKCSTCKWYSKDCLRRGRTGYCNEPTRKAKYEETKNPDWVRMGGNTKACENYK